MLIAPAIVLVVLIALAVWLKLLVDAAEIQRQIQERLRDE